MDHLTVWEMLFMFLGVLFFTPFGWVGLFCLSLIVAAWRGNG